MITKKKAKRKSGIPKDYIAKRPTAANKGAANASPSEVTIERAANGYITRHTKPPKKGEDYSYQSERNVHSSIDDVNSFVSKLFQGTPEDAKSRRVAAAKSVLSDEQD